MKYKVLVNKEHKIKDNYINKIFKADTSFLFYFTEKDTEVSNLFF